MASLLVGSVPMATVQSMASLSPNLSFSRSHSVAGSVSITAASPSPSISFSSLTDSNLPLGTNHIPFRIYCLWKFCDDWSFSSRNWNFDLISFSVYCGRGDKKTAKGKRFNHSFGNVSLYILVYCRIRPP